MPSVGILNVYKKDQGVTVAALLYYKVLSGAGFTTKFYQCVEGREDDYYSGGDTINGLRLPVSYIERAINRGIVFPLKFRSSQDDLLFLSDPWLLNLTFFKSNVIVLVHDLRLVTEHSPDTAQTLLFRMMLSRLSRVLKIICISETTKEALVEMGVSGSKIVVIPHWTDLEINAADRIHRTLDKIARGDPINVAYVANDLPYKRIDLFIDIAKRLSVTEGERRFNFILLSKLGPRTAHKVKETANERLVILDRVERMVDFYENVDVLLFPSEYEGFGIPLLEAMKAGIPIIARDLAITREVLGNAGSLMKSSLVEDWCGELRKFGNKVTYEAASKKSLDRSENFTLSKFEERVLSAFQEFRHIGSN